jgi:hypothetical protein
MEHILNNPSLTISLALAAGIIAQSIAHHIRMPVIDFCTGPCFSGDYGNCFMRRSHRRDGCPVAGCETAEQFWMGNPGSQ